MEIDILKLQIEVELLKKEVANLKKSSPIFHCEECLDYTCKEKRDAMIRRWYPIIPKDVVIPELTKEDYLYISYDKEKTFISFYVYKKLMRVERCHIVPGKQFMIIT